MELDNYKEVDFATYCKTCKHSTKSDFENPCDICLEEPARSGTKKPAMWEGDK